MKSARKGAITTLIGLRPVVDDGSIRALREDCGGVHVISAGIGAAMVGICSFY